VPPAASSPADPYGFDSLDLAWLRAKRSAKWSRHGTPFAAWVADMDFPPAPVVLDAIRAAADRADFGYPEWKGTGFGSPAVEVWADRCDRRYDWMVSPGEVREFCDVVQAVQVMLHLHTNPGDGVVLHTPSYPPLLDALDTFGLRLVDVPAHIGNDLIGNDRVANDRVANDRVANDRVAFDTVVYDYDALEERLQREGATVLLLCHPQNPTGHRFDRLELERLAAIAERFDLLVISDEIHADLTFAPATHVPFASLGSEVAARTVTVHSPSKAFNIAGLRHAVAHIGSARLRERLAALPNHLLGALNVVAADATVAAWTDGDDWLDAVVEYFDRNRRLTAELLGAHLPAVRYRIPEATYLAWLDCRACGFDDDPFEVFRGRGVQLGAGTDYGPGGAGFVRLNMATSAAILAATITAMATPA
jgi:cystathionine beta-lyase